MTNTEESKQDLITVSSGPFGSAAAGPLKVTVGLSGETVVKSNPEIGYLHRGIEKICERVSWLSVPVYAEKVDYLSSISCSLAYCLSVERLMNINVSQRASSIRLIVLELNRIASHLYYLAMVARQAGASTAEQYFLRDREKVNNLFEMLTGARLMYNYVRIGGVAFDVTDGFIEKTQEFLKYLLPKIEEYNQLLISNHIFSNRLKGIGVLKREDCEKFGISGPNARASGYAVDCRTGSQREVYSKYQNLLRSQIPNTNYSDTYMRFNYRISEIVTSVEIISEELKVLPEGKFREELSRNLQVSAGETYATVEGPRGNFGVYVVSSGGSAPERVKFVTPSMQIISALGIVLDHEMSADVPVIISSLDISVSEVDR